MTKEKYFLEICERVAKYSNCLRANIGVIIVKDMTIISTGWNSAPNNQKNCVESGECYREKNNIKSGTQLEKCKAVGSHAECMAICNAAKLGISINKSTLYMTGHDFVCDMCKAMIYNSGISNVVVKTRSGEIEKFISKYDWNIHSIDKE